MTKALAGSPGCCPLGDGGFDEGDVAFVVGTGGAICAIESFATEPSEELKEAGGNVANDGFGADSESEVGRSNRSLPSD